jgi:hypothetical protein
LRRVSDRAILQVMTPLFKGFKTLIHYARVVGVV